MISNIISRYRFKYARSLVYMLQASEYKIGDYLRWYHRTKDFARVEIRKKLEKTTKSSILLVILWLLQVVIYISVIIVIFAGASSFKYALSIVLILLAPYLLAYLAIVVLVILRIVQLPIEYLTIRNAKQKLALHTGLKIAIAGSYGKTSMREILKTVLSESKRVAAPPGSYNTPLGISAFIKGLKGDEEVLIFELGEYYPGDVMKLCRLVGPDIGIITGVNEAHLEKFKTLDHTSRTIFELAEYLGDKPVYVNSENSLAKKNSSTGHILYGREGIAKWKVINTRTGLGGTSFQLQNGSESLDLESNLLGLHQIGPIVAATHIANSLGLTSQVIQAGVAKTKPFDHRLELKTDANEVYTLDDSYNGNPDGVAAVIDFLAGLNGHRRFYVTPGLVEMGNRTEEIHIDIGKRLASTRIEKVVLIRNSVTPYIAKGLLESGYAGEIIWFGEALKAYASLSNMTIKGDVVLLQNDWPDQYA